VRRHVAGLGRCVSCFLSFSVVCELIPVLMRHYTSLISSCWLILLRRTPHLHAIWSYFSNQNIASSSIFSWIHTVSNSACFSIGIKAPIKPCAVHYITGLLCSVMCIVNWIWEMFDIERQVLFGFTHTYVICLFLRIAKSIFLNSLTSSIDMIRLLLLYVHIL